MTLAVRDDIRLAGRVLRYHTWPHVRQQTVAEHTWQVLRILIAIWPEVPAHVMRYAVGHDVGEVRVGDPPYPIKADNPVLRSEMDRLEGEAQVDLFEAWMMGDVPGLTEIERWAFKLAEFLEMWEWGWEETIMGNRFAELVRDRCISVAQEKFIGFVLTRTDLVDRVQIEITRRAVEYIARRQDMWRDA